MLLVIFCMIILYEALNNYIDAVLLNAEITSFV